MVITNLQMSAYTNNVCRMMRLFSFSLLRALFLWESRGDLVNYITVDPLRVCKKRVEEGKNDDCVEITTYSIEESEYDRFPPRLAQLVTLGVVTRSYLVAANTSRRCKYVQLHLSSLFANRFQSIVHIAYERVCTPLCAQISKGGFDFSTRGWCLYSTIADALLNRVIVSSQITNSLSGAFRGGSTSRYVQPTRSHPIIDKTTLVTKGNRPLEERYSMSSFDKSTCTRACFNQYS